MKQVIRKWLDLTQSLFRSRSHDAISAVEQVDLIFRTLLAVLPRVSSEVVGSNLDTAIDAMEHVRNWARLGEARRAESFLQYQIDVCSSSAALQDCMPLDLAYASVINAFSKDSNKEALSKAVYWLGRMENPPVEAFNSVLNAYSNRGLAEEAAAFFQDMKSKTSVVRDVFSYATVMKAWARSKRDDAQDYIESLLAELKNIYEAQGHPRRLMPNSFVYSIAMTHASPQRAEALLRELNECYEFSGDKEVQPNMRHYVGAMTRWARAGKPQEAERLLLECQEAYKRGNETLRPNHQVSFLVCSSNTIDAQSISQR
jgi:pentatricopeptide repeat protein